LGRSHVRLVPETFLRILHFLTIFVATQNPSDKNSPQVNYIQYWKLYEWQLLVFIRRTSKMMQNVRFLCNSWGGFEILKLLFGKPNIWELITNTFSWIYIHDLTNQSQQKINWQYSQYANWFYLQLPFDFYILIRRKPPPFWKINSEATNVTILVIPI
jgi:hypothetical protein